MKVKCFVLDMEVKGDSYLEWKGVEWWGVLVEGVGVGGWGRDEFLCGVGEGMCCGVLLGNCVV